MLIFAYLFEFHVPVAALVTEHQLDIATPEGTPYEARHEIAKIMIVAIKAFTRVAQENLEERIALS